MLINVTIVLLFLPTVVAIPNISTLATSQGFSVVSSPPYRVDGNVSSDMKNDHANDKQIQVYT